jgi:hypothetical protein
VNERLAHGNRAAHGRRAAYNEQGQPASSINSAISAIAVSPLDAVTSTVGSGRVGNLAWNSHTRRWLPDGFRR